MHYVCNMRILFKLLFFTFLVTALSCKKGTSWDVDAAFPIAKSHLNFSNFFGDTIFKADASGLLHIAFSKDIINFTMDSLVKLPDTTVSIGFTSPFSSLLNPGTVVFSNNASTDREITFNVTNGVELNRAIVKKGFLKVEYFNTYPQPLNFNYQINSASLWGNILHINQTISGGTVSSPSTLTKLYPLDDYLIILTGLSNTKINTLVQSYTITTDPSGSPDQLLPGQGLSVKLSFSDVVPAYVQGYFGQQDLSFGPDSTLLGMFENFKPSNFALTQSAINFRIINEFGIELSSTISNIRSIKTAPPNVVQLNAGNLLQTINVNRAGKTNNASNPVFPWVKQIDINSSNSNLNAFLENVPNYLGYKVQAKLNPLGNISAGNDFAYFGHGLRVIADVDVPFEISADYFNLINYAKIDLTGISQLSHVNNCEMILQARNNYPFRAQIQGYMVNDQNQIVDSMFTWDNNTIRSAVTDNANTVLNFTDTKLIAYFNKDNIDNLRSCSRVKFVTYLYLPNQPTPIKIKDSSYLDLLLSANVNYNVNTK
jgi:hypothetical protein